MPDKELSKEREAGIVGKWLGALAADGTPESFARIDAARDIAWLIEQLKTLRAQLAPSPCGHRMADIVQVDEETGHDDKCRACARETRLLTDLRERAFDAGMENERDLRRNAATAPTREQVLAAIPLAGEK